MNIIERENHPNSVQYLSLKAGIAYNYASPDNVFISKFNVFNPNIEVPVVIALGEFDGKPDTWNIPLITIGPNSKIPISCFSATHVTLYCEQDVQVQLTIQDGDKKFIRGDLEAEDEVMVVLPEYTTVEYIIVNTGANVIEYTINTKDMTKVNSMEILPNATVKNTDSLRFFVFRSMHGSSFQVIYN